MTMTIMRAAATAPTGDVPPDVIETLLRAHLQSSLPIMEAMEQRVIQEARRWLV